jgi:hypothetical protein
MEKITVGNVSLEKWKAAFAIAVANSFGHDDFSDILFYDLYPNTSEEAANIAEDDEEKADEVYNEKWDYAYEAFKEIFGIGVSQAYNIDLSKIQ